MEAFLGSFIFRPIPRMLRLLVACSLLFLFSVATFAQQDLQTAHAHFNRALKEYQGEHYQEAVNGWSQALKLYQTLRGTERDQAECCGYLGIAMDHLGKYEESMAQQQQALKLYLTLQKTEGEQANCYGNLGVVLSHLGKYEEAMAQHQQALKLFHILPGTKSQQAVCYSNLGIELQHLAKYKEAMAQQQQALDIYQTRGDTEREQADCYGNLGVSLSSLGKFEEAITQYQRALRFYHTLRGAERKQATCYMNLGVTLNELGKYKEAMVQYQHALDLDQTLQGTEREQAACYVNLGVSLKSLGIPEEAMVQYQQALKIYQMLQGSKREQAACYANLGVVLSHVGKYEEAMAQHQRALMLYQTLQGTEREQASCYRNLGGIQWWQAKYEEAMAQHQRALMLCQTLQGTEHDQAACYVNLGAVLVDLGKYEEAMTLYRRALMLYQTLQGTRFEQCSTWRGIGFASLRDGRFHEAIGAFEHAGKDFLSCLGQGQAYRRSGNLGSGSGLVSLLHASELAESYRAEMMAREHREGLFERMAAALPELVGLLAELGNAGVAVLSWPVRRWTADSQTASSTLEAAFHFADQGKGRSLNDALWERSTLKAARADTRLLAEDKELSQRISKLTTMREQLPETQIGQKEKLAQDIEELQQRRNMIEVELKKTALGGYVAPEFRKPMEMAADLSPDTAVLQYSVGEKEIWLLVLTRDGVTAHKLGCETLALPELRPRQQATVAQLVEAWQKRPDKIGLDGLVHLARERAEDQGREVKQNLLDATQEQAIFQRLGNNVLPAAALTELRQKKTRHLLVIPDGSLHYVPFAMLRLDGVMEQGSAGVLGKAESGKREGERGKEAHYLIEEFSVSYTPAMTTLETVRKQKKEREQKRKMERRQLLAFTNPAYGSEGVPTLPAKMAGDDMVTRLRSVRDDYYKSGGLRLTSLPETEQEAMRVASLFGPPKQCSDPTVVDTDASALVLTSKAASEEQAKRLLSPVHLLPRYRYLLFSSHGFADSHNGMLSCLALSSPAADSAEDGFLQAQEVLDFELDTDLVMLSACQTGLGRMRGGEGLVGLSASFFIAGAESVCASLWQVPSGPTTQLTTEFFRNLEGNKLNRAEALRQAQLTVMRCGQSPDDKSADYSSPFCWAPFVLMGEYLNGEDMITRR